MTAPQQFLTETRERFLLAVLQQLPADRVRELYLFQPIRQGGVESGVAVVAAYPDAPAAPPEGGPEPAEAPSDDKYTVYTARYRHTIKGPDRGKWEASVVAEADAPLLSIETVVRGVQRRAGDVEPPDHMSGAELRAALRLPPSIATATGPGPAA